MTTERTRQVRDDLITEDPSTMNDWQLEDYLERLKAGAQQVLGELYDDPRIAKAAYESAAALDALERPERVVVSTMVLLCMLANFKDKKMLLKVISAVALAHRPEVATVVWVDMAREFGVQLTTKVTSSQ